MNIIFESDTELQGENEGNGAVKKIKVHQGQCFVAFAIATAPSSGHMWSYTV